MTAVRPSRWRYLQGSHIGSAPGCYTNFREVLPPTIFFVVGFNFVVFTTNLLVAEYDVAVSNFMLA